MRGIDPIKTGENIRAMRLDAGYPDKTDFALMMGTTRQKINDWERGAVVPQTVMLHKMAQLFDCYMDDIIVGTEER